MRADYQKFGVYLNNCNADQIKLSFKEIEKILGKKLPPSAFKHESWWGNTNSQPFMKQVIKNGWKQAYVGVLTEVVEFKKVIYKQKSLIAKIPG